MKTAIQVSRRGKYNYLIGIPYFLVKIFLLASIIDLVTANLVVAQKSPSSIVAQQNSERTTDLLHRGKQLYDRGQLTAAAKIWEQARQSYIQDRQLANLIHSNNYLATVYQDLGNWEQAEKAIANNLELIATSKQSNSRRNTTQINSPLLYAQTLNVQASWLLKQGRGEAAFTTWQEAEALYRDIKDTTGVILSQINQAQALQTLGFYRRSQTTLNRVRQQLDSTADFSLKIAALHSLGVALEVAGDIEQAQKVLEQSLSLAKQVNLLAEMGQSLFYLGNVARSQDNYQLAVNYYQKAIAITPDAQTKLESELNQLSLLIKTNNITAVERLVATIKPKLFNLPASRQAIYAKINYAQSLIEINNPSAKEVLLASLKQAQSINDNIVRAYALEKLGHWYELNRDYDRALKLSHQALTITEASNISQITAAVHWQRGRIFQAQDKKQQAILAYQSAVSDLENLDRDLVAVNPNLQFSFRQQVEPVYRQLVELLLEDLNRLTPATRQEYLESSRVAIEALQQKELENFFRIACLDVNKQDIEQIDPQAAVIYPILLDRSVEVILSVPGQPLQHYRTLVDVEQQAQTFNELLQYLNPVFSSKDLLPTAQRLYDWLIRPGETILQQQNIKTIVFVLDGNLRSLPMSVLHDTKQYLIEKYNLALTPGLELLPTQTLNRDKLNVLTGGLTKPRQEFSALPGVAAEIASINQIMPAQVLLNDNFTSSMVQEKIANQPTAIVHLATHGQFSSSAEDTYILTWDDRINVNEFDRLLRYRNNELPIELLVLSACKTAAGDERAILGLAGIAIRSGARSTVATLWSVNDRSTAELMTKFYSYLKRSNITKAQAMRKAQLSLLQKPQYHHPYYWSPFVLLGNWR